MLNNLSKSIFLLVASLILGIINSNCLARGHTARISLNSQGIQSNGFSQTPHLSANGRYVTFTSLANNLISGDSNGYYDVFVRDLLTQEITRISVNSQGLQSNGYSQAPQISADGRYVAFQSSASNLINSDTNHYYDIFVHDRATKQTIRASVNSQGLEANGYSLAPCLSSDGRYVAYQSSANNLISNDTNQHSDIFLYDRLSKTTNRVSVSSQGTESNDNSETPDINATGRYITFQSNARNLVSGDTNQYPDIFVRDRFTRETSRISVSSTGVQSNNASYAPQISADGRYVVFQSWASNLVSNDTNGTADIFLHDRLTKQTMRLSVNSQGKDANSYSEAAEISADGRYVTFQSYANNLVAGDTNNQSDIFVYNRLTNQISRVNINNQNIQSNSYSASPRISADGRYITFYSYSTNLVPNDTNQHYDIFLRDLWLSNDGTNADLQIAANQKPIRLGLNNQGNFVFTITNKGPNSIGNARVQHLLNTNGTVVNLVPSQGTCRRYATIALCDLSSLSVGGSATLQVTLKALRHPVSQQLTIYSGGRPDLLPANNYLNLNTPVTP